MRELIAVPPFAFFLSAPVKWSAKDFHAKSGIDASTWQREKSPQDVEARKRGKSQVCMSVCRFVCQSVCLLVMAPESGQLSAHFVWEQH